MVMYRVSIGEYFIKRRHAEFFNAFFVHIGVVEVANFRCSFAVAGTPGHFINDGFNVL